MSAYTKDINEAIADLEDRDMPELVLLLKRVDRWMDMQDEKYRSLVERLNKVEFGGF